MLSNQPVWKATLRFQKSVSFLCNVNRRSIQTIPFTRNHNLNNIHKSSSAVKSIFCSTSSRKTLSSLNNIRFYHFSHSSQDYEPEEIAPVRTKLRVADVLKVMQEKNFTISHSASIMDAIAHLVKEKLSSALVVNSDQSIAGIFTARDLLKFISDSTNITSAHSVRSIGEVLLRTKISDMMTKREKLVYCSPNDSVQRCREIMFQCKIRNMPVLENGDVKGIITMKALADSSFNLMEIGGKKGFIHNVTGRRGIPDSAKVSRNDNTGYNTGNECFLPPKLDLEIGYFVLPHPFKSNDGASMNHKLYGAKELADDVTLSEDASFAVRLSDKIANNPLDVIINEDSLLSSHSHSNSNNNIVNNNNNQESLESHDGYLPLGVVPQSSQAFICVADGVGSWRQYDVDPRQFSHRIVENAKKVIESDLAHRAIIGTSPFDKDLASLHPFDILMDAWNLTVSESVVGSSTFCIATLDKKLNQIHYANVGDCGLMVIRLIDSETAGYMRDRQPRHLRSSDMKIAYLSQQQLKGFNLPYQLGFSNIPDTPQVFETPSDADVASIPVMPGDIIVMATDGLFDNLDLNEVVDEVGKWENEHFKASVQDLRLPSRCGNKEVQTLAERLVRLSRELSLDNNRDSPFAILAKENDIMWGGGMPDDTTVIVARVVSV